LALWSLECDNFAYIIDTQFRDRMVVCIRLSIKTLLAAGQRMQTDDSSPVRIQVGDPVKVLPERSATTKYPKESKASAVRFFDI
jgi:hypothetical protein